MSIAKNYQDITERIGNAALAAGRAADSVKLLAVSKLKPLEDIQALYEVGQRDFGENRMPEGANKVAQANFQTSDAPISWHFIGHVQSRKARDVVANFDLLHSIDSLKLAETINRKAEAIDKVMPVLIECNVSGEESKHGFKARNGACDIGDWDALRSQLNFIFALPNLEVRGLMTMAPFHAAPEDTRPVFRDLRNLRDKLQDAYQLELPELSMGMTNDFEVAIQEGSTLVRVGRALFGERN